MVERSNLYCPGDEPRKMRKALGSGADAVTLDIEDSVAPAAKDQAREEIRELLAENGEEDVTIFVRMNPLDEGGTDDLAAVIDGVDHQPDALVLPMVETPEAVERLAAELDRRDSNTEIAAVIETARGLLEAPRIAAANGTDTLGFGAEDLTADIGARRTAEGTELLYARQRIVVAAAAAGITASDTVYTDIEDLDGLARDARFAVDMGFQGKAAIHPSQVDVINDAFTPDSTALEWAERVLDAEAATDKGVFTVDGQMVDSPLVERARTIVSRAEAAGIR